MVKAMAGGIGKAKVRANHPDIPSQANAGDAVRLDIDNSNAQKARASPRAMAPRVNGKANHPWLLSMSPGGQPVPGTQPAGSQKRKKEDSTLDS